jgi:DNA-binding winged helix-turn-helix (wHTH) protein
MATMPRFRFGSFTLSPAHRVLVRDGAEVPLIPRYFDLLVLLVSRRHQAVSRHEIFDEIWKDVVVSDGALSQAVRTIRRALGDDPRDPQFVRTVARHGYQFICRDVVEESDSGPLPQIPQMPQMAQMDFDPFAPLLDRLLRRGAWESASEADRREAAELLHGLATSEALRRLDALPGHAEARAILRDTRWDVPGAGDVPLIGSDGGLSAALALVGLRLRRAARVASSRWASAAAGGAVAGVFAGVLGGVALWLVPDSHTGIGVVTALAMVGGLVGAIGAAGVGAGLAVAEALARSQRALALALCGAAGGAIIGSLGHLLARATVSGVFGHDLSSAGGSLEGLVIGAAAGIGYAMPTSPLPGGGMAAPRGRERTRTAVVTGSICALAALLLSAAGGHFVASSLDVTAGAFEGSKVGLAPIARLLGEGDLRPVTRALVSAFEGLLFGAGLAFGLTYRPRPS